MKKITLVALLLLSLIIFIPQGFAADNETVSDGTDYYFDIDAVSDGNGTLTAPYKNFTDNRIKDHSTIHLSEGEYVFQKSRSFNNISFYGSSAQDTILNGNGATLTVNGNVSFKNITLTNFKIVSNGNLSATNAHFTELLPYRVDSDNNNFGGAIYAAANKNIYLDNCTIFNNFAEYAGAIYVKGGNLTVLNSIFCNNTAYNYAGAILGESKARIIVNNTKFISDKSIDDAGGAIYLLSSSLIASNSEFINCSATFGSAITALKSDLNLTNLTFHGNVAKYDGGAIYQFYGSLTLNSSRFISNAAGNGAGIYINDVNVVNFTSNVFINNTASNYAGAIYSLLGRNADFETSIFENNSAYLYNDVYNTSGVNLTFGNGNYTLYAVNLTSNLTIPESYDLRDYGLVTSVKNQLRGGNCWAFSALAALESCILKASGEILDLSEESMKNLMAVYSDYGRKIRNPNDGGEDNMPFAYLVSWLGPVFENEDKYDDYSQLSPVLNSLMHVQNIMLFKRNNYTDNDVIKQAIMNYGAVVASLYYSGSYLKKWTGNRVGYYCTEDEDANHEVVIVGWDDNITVPNAPGKGAWIAKNSWGDSWLSEYGQDGYFYVSYYDSTFARPGGYNSYTFLLNDTQRFDKNYQYDVSGVTDYFYNTARTVWYENAFYATDDEFLAAVSTYFNQDTDWEFYIYVNSKLQLIQRGSSAPGYFTINLDYPVPLASGDLFEILFRITTKGDVGFPIMETVSTTKCTYAPGISFVSYDGYHFQDLYDLVWEGYPGHKYNSQVACIKGFTQLITLNSTSKPLNITYDSFDLYNIILNLLDENDNPVGNGNVTFTVNGENHTVNVYMGIASLRVPFVLGLNNISWSFTSPNYYSCNGNCTYEVLPIKLDMNISVLQDFNNAIISFTLSQPINENFTVTVNGVNQTIESVNGYFSLNLTDLEYGEYNIATDVLREIYDCQNSTQFFVNVKRTYFKLDNLTVVYNCGEFYMIQLLDQFNAPLSNASVRYSLNNVSYLNFTDFNGFLVVPIDFEVGNYSICVFFDGDDLHVKSQNSSKLTVNPSKTYLNISSITYDSFDLFDISVNVTDQSGNVLNYGKVIFEVNGETFTVNVSDVGAVLKIPLILGNNNISARFISANHYGSGQNMSFEVTPIHLDMDISVLQVFNNASIRFTFSQLINESLSVSINGVNRTLEIVDGVSYLDLTGLDYGDYHVFASVLRDIYDSSNSTDFFVNVTKTHFALSNLTTFYNSGEFYTVQLLDQFDVPLADAQIGYLLNNVTYFNVTDSNGFIYVPIDLEVANYSIAVFFDGDDLHVKSQNSSGINVIPSKTYLNISSITYDSLDLYDIEVNVTDQAGHVPDSGKVIFDVNGETHTVNVGDLKTVLKVSLLRGMNNISATFFANNFYESVKNISFEVMPIHLDMDISVLQVFNNASIRFTFSQLINESLSVSINGVNQTLEIVDGVYCLDLTGLEYGEYHIFASVLRDIYDSRNSTDFFVDVRKTHLEADDFETVYNSGMLYSIRLLDQFGMPVVNCEVRFIIAGNVYFNTTDENGCASAAISLKDSSYATAVSFAGDDLYISSQNSSVITVKSSIKLPANAQYALNSNYEFYMIDRYGNPLNDSIVNVVADYKSYDVKTDGSGKGVFAIPFASGNFIVEVTNPDTGENLSQNIAVVKRITDNKDMSFYFGNTASFKVRVCDDDGKYSSGIYAKLTVNGKSYNMASDDNGWVSLKIKLNVGKYTITAEYKGFKVSNKITVKTTLITKNKKFKKAKTIKYTAKLLNKNGKAYKGKKITFKIKGKIYTAKTNKKGIATIKIRNLKAGKYKVTAKFSKLTSSSRITIKK